MEEILEMHRQQEADMVFRHRWVPLFYNWVIAILIVALFGSFIWWGIRIHRENHDAAVRQAVYDEMDAEHAQMLADAAEAQRQKDEADTELQIREAKAIARMFFGARNFIAKYGYTNEDLLTYARCPVNRAEASGRTIEEVLAEPGQFIAYSENNDLETEYYNLALQFVADLHDGKLPPCETKFKYAVFKDTGIWLVDDPGKPVPERWHA